MHNTSSTQGQWIGDVSVKDTGSIETMFDFAVQNNLSVTDNLTAGCDLFFSEIQDKRIVNYYLRNNLTPATAIIETLKQGGIGYMAVGIDFIVS